MNVKILYFAVLRERRGVSAETLDLPDGADVAMALAMIAKQNPGVAPLLPRAQVAVNQAIVAATTPLGEGDELALIPPVSGGATNRSAVRDVPLSLDEVSAVVLSGERGGLVTFSGLVRSLGCFFVVERLVFVVFCSL